LLSLFIVAIVAGLIVEAVGTTHEAAYRTQCINNNKQISLAVNNYASSYQNILPPLTSDEAKPKGCTLNGGIFLNMVPFIEAGDLFNLGALALPICTWYAPVPPSKIMPFSTTPPGAYGEPLCSATMKVFHCPADATVIDGYSANQSVSNTRTPPYFFRWAAASYSANYQLFGTENDLGSANSGNFCGPRYAIDKIPGGAANTVFFGEQFAACGSSAGNLWAYPGIGNYSATQYSSAAPGAHAPVGVDDSIVNTAETTNGYLWTPVFANDHPVYGFTVGGLDGSIAEYNAAEPAGPLVAPFAPGQFWDAPPQTGISRSQCDKSRLQSFHTACVMVAMGDGSVRLVSPSVAQATWYAVIMPADGNAPGADW
jgi:Protein of unknown function (DUF1559)